MPAVWADEDRWNHFATHPLILATGWECAKELHGPILNLEFQIHLAAPPRCSSCENDTESLLRLKSKPCINPVESFL